ncbi:RNA helicase [Bifidobacterium aemilianum]|uniref:RNA helicase n=1 Tax=Bifidobacterium aemilianum TaxID=2493120 RepID=A0A366KA93_9BIFI|nr:DUF3427 domain-containing protein [Bifidobacterium aemilianum]RBP98634.1 RNA helicase [Bifidobacterium aemilianum]
MSTGSTTNATEHDELEQTTQQLITQAALSGFVRENSQVQNDFEPILIANHDGLTMERALRNELDLCQEFDMSVAFISQFELQSLKQNFLNFAHSVCPDDRQGCNANRGTASKGRPAGRIITSTYNYFNSPRVFSELLKLQMTTGIEVRVWQAGIAPKAPSPSASYGYHPKGYIFRRTSKDGEVFSAYIGSSNLTDRALRLNREWNLKVSATGFGSLPNQIASEIETQIEESVPLDADWLNSYEEEFKQHAPLRPVQAQSGQPSEHMPIIPNAMQNEALESLKRLRSEGENRAVIISATGTGKTYLSAFDVKACKPRRMLYIAHRQQILKTAMESYKMVLGVDDSQVGLLSGSSKERDKTYLFATIQSLSQQESLSGFKPDDFDYILVDEAHHAAAGSYGKVINYFRPKFMLGMTATPERSDGENIFALFGSNIAYEIRLQRALEENMLCPFHYYGVSEYGIEKDGSQGTTASLAAQSASNKDRTNIQGWFERLTDPKRVRYIIDKIQQYSQAGVPIKGLIFCSRVEEARKLSSMFNQQFNEQAERPFRTCAATSQDSSEYRQQAIELLTNGELDYIFTVDLYNEGIDIPAINQIVMLRQTQSSIIFTQQLGRGLRKAEGKDSVVVIDFIGNYANNYLIPLALYGNTGDRDRARKNMQKESIGISSISFDPIAKELVLQSLAIADLSEMKRLSRIYRELRFELGRLPLLADIVERDSSLVYTLASKNGNYLNFAQSRELSLSNSDTDSFRVARACQSVNITEKRMLTMLTSTQLRGLRPHVLLALRILCGFDESDLNLARKNTDDFLISAIVDESAGHHSISIKQLQALVRREFPLADNSDDQCQSALSFLDYSYFYQKNRERFGGTPMVREINRHTYALSAELMSSLRENPTFAWFFRDTVLTGLTLCTQLYSRAEEDRILPDHGFIYGEKYSIFDVMQLCGWRQEQIPQNVGGYKLDKDTGTMPIFIKYEASQYGDRFLTTENIEWFSKNGRTLSSPEYRWLCADNHNTSVWELREQFVPVFIKRKAEEKENTYYFVGNVTQVIRPHESINKEESGNSHKVVISTLHLNKPVDPELFQHLTGQPAF